EVADVLGNPDRAEVLARRRDHPDSTRPGHPDVPALVAFHPVGDPLFDHTAADALEEHPAVGERTVAFDIPDLDVRTRRVVDVEQRLVRREAEAVRHVELVLRDDELELVLPPTRGNAEHALPAELAVALDAEAGKAPVPRVGEVDRPVRPYADVVGAV